MFLLQNIHNIILSINYNVKKIKINNKKRKIPEKGWEDTLIQDFLFHFSLLDSNNFINKCGAGEREGRVFSQLVSHRHFGFSHGVGRSGDLAEFQPKAVGSSALSRLANALVLSLIRKGLNSKI